MLVRPRVKAWRAGGAGPLRRLFQADWVDRKIAAVQDKMPAFALKVNQHRVGMGEIVNGVRRRTFHEISDEKWALQNGGAPDLERMKTAVREAYASLNGVYGQEEAFEFDVIATKSLEWFDSIQLD